MNAFGFDEEQLESLIRTINERKQRSLISSLGENDLQLEGMEVQLTLESVKKSQAN